MKLKYTTAVLTVIFLSQVLVFPVRADLYPNKLAERKSQQKARDEVDNIPVYRQRLTGDYEILGFVQGQDAFTKNKKAILNGMRLKAYKMGANAIMEFSCRKRLGSLFQNCEGFAIYWKGELPSP